MSKIATLMLHGMGERRRPEKFRSECLGVLGAIQAGAPMKQLDAHPVFYSDVLQGHQDKLFKQYRDHTNIDYVGIRQFMFNRFADATSYESRPLAPSSAYKTVHQRIRTALQGIEGQHGASASVVVLAHSLGAQVLSNYLWDAQTQSGGWESGDSDLVCGKTVQLIVTTGCNIPMFVSGKNDIRAIETAKDGYDVRWINFFDEDDVLGWPLRPLDLGYKNNGQHGQSYADAVDEDIEVNADTGWWSWAWSSWNPFSHSNYWGDSDVIKRIAAEIQQLP